MLGTCWSGYLGSTEHTETPGCGTPMATCCSRPRSTPSLVLVLEGDSLDLAQDNTLTCIGFENRAQVTLIPGYASSVRLM